MNSSGAAPVPPSLPSTTMKSGVVPLSSMALQMARNSTGWPRQSLKPTGLPPDSPRNWSMKSIISQRRRKGAVAGRRNAVRAHRHAADGGDFGRDLGGGQHAAMAGLGALAELDLDHLDLRILRVGGKSFRRECAVGVRQPK